MRILITGATGFIGSRLVTRLAQTDEVYALVRSVPALPEPNVRYIIQDLRHSLARERLPSEVDAVIHQAAVIDTDHLQQDSVPFEVNVIATWRLLEYAAEAGARTFVHASTGGIYGCCDRPLRESDPPHPMDLYSLTKAQAELAVNASSASFHRIVLRYFFPYGIGTPNPIPSYVRRAVLGEPIEVLRSGKPALNPLHIEDAVEATVQTLSLDTDYTLNIAGTERTSFAEIAELAGQAAGKTVMFRTISDDMAIPYYRSNLLADTERMRSVLDFSPAISLREGIAELTAHYLRSRA